MASALFTTHDQHYKVILLGKSGSGVSASGNTILGKKRFISQKKLKSVTQDVQNETVVFHEVSLDVHDTPGLFNTEIRNETILEKWQPLLQLDETTCTVILWVMKIDRFTLEDKEAVPLIKEFIPEHLIQNTWILFTRGDELSNDFTIEQFIEDTEEVKKLVKKFHNRYHVFENSSQSPGQVLTLVNKIKNTAQIIFSDTPDPEELPHRRIMLLGKTGVGKSTTGNTILREDRFRSEISSSFITSETEIHHGVFSGRKLSVIDTPGLFDTKLSREKLSVVIERSIYLSSPGPHAFLYIQPLNVRFTEQEENVVQKLEGIFGKEMRKYTMILFTHGDLLKGKSVDALIQENQSLKTLVDECGGGYHVFNNTQRSRDQVSELLQKIDRMVKKNGAARLRQQEEEWVRREKALRLRQEMEEWVMREEAARLRRNKMRKDQGFNRFCKNIKRFLLIAGVGCGLALTNVTGPVGAVIGAVISAAIWCWFT